MFYRLPICFIIVKLHSRSVSTLPDFSHIEVNFVWKVQQQCVCSLHLFYWQDIQKPFGNDWRLCSGHALEIRAKQWNSEQLWIQKFSQDLCTAPLPADTKRGLIHVYSSLGYRPIILVDMNEGPPHFMRA